jgi:Mg2+ and Co2+ transporter CorA
MERIHLIFYKRTGCFHGKELCVIRQDMVKNVKDSVDKTQEELMEEIAKALGHSGDQLESILMQLKELEDAMDQTKDDDEFNERADKFNSLRKLALIRRQMLVIHREAIGVLKHSYIDIFYPIPGKKKKRP